MIVVIPIVIGAPAMGVFIPPATVVFPTVGTGFGEFLAPVLGLGTIPAVMLGGFMKFMIRVADTLLAVVVSTGSGGSDKRTEGSKENDTEQARNG